MRLRVFLDQHAEAAVAAVGAAVELLEILGREQLAVWIVELADQSLRRLLVDVVYLKRVDVALANERHDLLQQRGALTRSVRLQDKSAGDDGDSERADQRELPIAFHAGVQRNGDSVNDKPVRRARHTTASGSAWLVPLGRVDTFVSVPCPDILPG